MIGKLTGTIDSVTEDHAILDVNGVGYVVNCSTRNLPEQGEKIAMWIETIMRQDAIQLYGFSTPVEREWFRLLHGVQGVGSKLALAIQSTLSSEDISSAIALQDSAMIARAPGVGPKLAGRIVAELRDKAPSLSARALEADGIASSESPSRTAALSAISALINLGYSSDQASRAISKASQRAGENPDEAELIRLGLKELAS